MSSGARDGYLDLISWSRAWLRYCRQRISTLVHAYPDSVQRTYGVTPFAIMQSIRKQLAKLDISAVDSVLVQLPGIDDPELGVLGYLENSIADPFRSFGASVISKLARKTLCTTCSAPGFGVDGGRRDEDDLGGRLGLFEKGEDCLDVLREFFNRDLEAGISFCSAPSVSCLHVECLEWS